MNTAYRVEDRSDLRHYRTEIPNLVDEMDLSPFAFRLYAHLKRVAGDSGKCWQSVETMAAICKMSKGSISNARQELVDAGLIFVTPERTEHGGKDTLTITIVDVWARNFQKFFKPAPCGGVATPPDELATPPHGVATPRGDHKEEPFKKEPIKKSEEDPYSPCPDLQALGVLTGVTGMLAFPGSLDDQAAAIGKIRAVMAGRNVPQTVEYLKPYYAEWRKRRYSKVNLAWLDWALAGEWPQPRAAPAGASPPRPETEEEFQVRKLRMQEKFAAAQAARKDNPDAANPGKPAAQTAPPLHPGGG